MIIYHNPRCSTSREVMGLLEKKKIKFEIRDYLQVPPSKKELKELLEKLGCKAIDLVRKKEALYLEKFKEKELSNGEWIDVLAKYPILIQRPIVIDEKRAIIGRPPELVINFLKKK
ncbi:MAG: arsenate reductase (glutaredoxin) [bacterium]|nr:arsenate reductase (glutaredoxin) [bacterium]